MTFHPAQRHNLNEMEYIGKLYGNISGKYIEVHDTEHLREENQRLRAAVEEMEKMLPVLNWLANGVALKHAMEGEEASLDTYRQSLEIALAKRNEP